MLLRVWKYFGTSLVVIGFAVFLLQPIIRIAIAGTEIYITTPGSALVIVVIGILIRIECAIRDV